MPFEFAVNAADLPPGGLTEVNINGRCYALANVDGDFYAIDGTCPHRGAPLGQGALHGKTIVCPWHAWEFDATTGRHDYNPTICQKKYAVEVQGREVLIDVD